MAAAEEPILSRLDRLDNMVRQLEEIRGGGRSSPRSWSPSTASTASDGHPSSTDLSPKSMEKHCRPVDRVMVETEVKGTLLDRLSHVEDRVLKLEEELEAEKKRGEQESQKKKKGFKNLVKKVVKGGSHNHDNHHHH